MSDRPPLRAYLCATKATDQKALFQFNERLGIVVELHSYVLEGPVDISTPKSGVINAVLGIRTVRVHIAHRGNDFLFPVNGLVG